MALVILQTPPLSPEQKQRIGERILQGLHAEGLPASQTVVLFQPERSDLYLEGGLLVEAIRSAPELVPQVSAPEPFRTPELEPAAPARRRSRGEQQEYLQRLVGVLQRERAVTSFQAQAALGLKDDPTAASLLRALFKTLEDEGLIRKEGQRRGTRYLWAGEEDGGSVMPAPRLVKRDDDEDGAGEA